MQVVVVAQLILKHRQRVARVVVAQALNTIHR
jgi:hypothetical protein